ncbi:MAG: IS605 OrfB family transposase, partial [Myxococcota bacterium]
MFVLKAHRYRLDPSTAQAATFRQWAGCSRWTYNAALSMRESTYTATGKGAGLAALCRLLTGWRAEHDWLRACPSQIGQQSIHDMLDAYNRFFKGQNARPTLKRKGRCRESFRFPNQKSGKTMLLRVERLSRKKARIKLPKVGWVKLRLSRPIDGEIRSVTVSRDGKHWFASVLLRTDEEAPPAPTVEEVREERRLGLDLGVVQTVTTSDGEVFSVPTMGKGDERHMRRLQRRLSRRQGPRRGVSPSRRWLKAKAALQRFHAQLRWRRLDTIHKLTATLTNGEQTDAIVMEDLNVKGMTTQKRGKGRRAKAKLNAAILSQAWGEIRRQLVYKSERAGIAFRVVDPAYTSQMCSKCGHTERMNRTTQADFECRACGHTDNADHNAAKNISAAGQAAAARPQAGTRGRKTTEASG